MVKRWWEHEGMDFQGMRSAAQEAEKTEEKEETEMTET